VECAVDDREVLVGRDDVDPVRLDTQAVRHLRDLHLGHALEQLGHEPLARRVEVLDDDEGETARLGHMTQELPQSFQPARRCADPDDDSFSACLPRQGGTLSSCSTRHDTADGLPAAPGLGSCP